MTEEKKQAFLTEASNLDGKISRSEKSGETEDDYYEEGIKFLFQKIIFKTELTSSNEFKRDLTKLNTFINLIEIKMKMMKILMRKNINLMRIHSSKSLIQEIQSNRH